MKQSIYLCLLALSVLAFTSQKASAQYTITSYSMTNGCMGFDSGTVRTSGYTTGMTVLAYYGDGTSGSTTVYSSGTTGFATIFHPYALSGTYTIKYVLVYGGVDIDSVIFNQTILTCKHVMLWLYNDVNADCIWEAGTDFPIYSDPATLEVDSAGVAIDTIVATCGADYDELGPTGTIYSFKVIIDPLEFTHTCPTTGIVYDTVGLSYGTDRDIAFQCTGSGFDLAVNAYWSAGLDGAGSNTWVTAASCTAMAATLRIDYSPKYSFSGFYGGYSYPYTVSGNSVSISISSISDISPVTMFPVWLPVGTLTLGDTAQVHYTILPITGDADTVNNRLDAVDTIRTSWDPNGKSVYPQGTISSGTKLQYSIAFENTGTDTAFNIHIMDTLSDDLDINTIQVISASAPMTYMSTTYMGHNIVKFDFAHINLLDTASHGISSGMVVFTINAKTGLAVGTKIDNEAGIYFDDNVVVMTNNVENVIGMPLNVAPMTNVAKATLYPNPANDMVTISADNNIYYSFTFTNTLGQVIMNHIITSSQTQVNVNELPAGIYYISLKGEGGVKVLKFEKN